MPDLAGIFANRAIRRELPHAGDVLDRALGPRPLIAETLIHFILRLRKGREIRQYHIVITPVHEGMEDVREAQRIVGRKEARANLIERHAQFGVFFV